MFSEEELAKLPKWARHKVEALECNVATHKRAIDEMQDEAKPEHGRIILHKHEGDTKVLDGFTVGFVGTDLTVRMSRGALLIMSGDNSVYAHSAASNCLYAFSATGMEQLAKTAR